MTYLPFYYAKVASKGGVTLPTNEAKISQAVAAEFALSKLNEHEAINLIIENKEGDVIFNNNLCNPRQKYLAYTFIIMNGWKINLIDMDFKTTLI